MGQSLPSPNTIAKTELSLEELQGFRGKNPRGWGFFLPILIEASRKKNPTPGAFSGFFEYCSDDQTYMNKKTVF